MQNFDNLERIAYEAVEDLRNQDVAYGELRFAPFQHLNDNFKLNEIVKSAYSGIKQGEKDFGGEFNIILCAMRQHDNSKEVAELAIRSIEDKVVGFDLAGPEYNFPPSKHLEACLMINESDIGLTIHAGEAADISYIEEAVFECKADRIGHGWQIIYGCEETEEMYIPSDKISNFIHLHQIPLEICISSNVKSGASEVNIANHPAVKLIKGGFNITLNTDNRLMAKTSIKNEFMIARNRLDLDNKDEKRVIENSFKAIFSI